VLEHVAVTLTAIADAAAVLIVVITSPSIICEWKNIQFARQRPAPTLVKHYLK